MRDLKDVRRDINAIDHEILKLFLKRMKCAEEVSDYKMEHGGQVLVPSRETELMNTMLQDIPNELKLEYSSLLRTTTRVSRKHQYARMLEAEPQRMQLALHPRNNDETRILWRSAGVLCRHCRQRFISACAAHPAKLLGRCIPCCFGRKSRYRRRSGRKFNRRNRQ